MTKKAARQPVQVDQVPPTTGPAAAAQRVDRHEDPERGRPLLGRVLRQQQCHRCRHQQRSADRLHRPRSDQQFQGRCRAAQRRGADEHQQTDRVDPSACRSDRPADRRSAGRRRRRCCRPTTPTTRPTPSCRTPSVSVSRATLTIVVSSAVIDAPITVTARTLAPRDIPRTCFTGERRVNDIAGTVLLAGRSAPTSVPLWRTLL